MNRSDLLKVGLGLGVLCVIFGIWFAYDIAGDPTSYDVIECNSGSSSPEQLGFPNMTCQEIEQLYEDTTNDGMLACCLSCFAFIGAISVLVMGLLKKDAPVIQYVPYTTPAQPTYATPPVQQQQPSAHDIELELKQRRMLNVETLKQEGRFMEAALEAEMAGEYNIAAELRRQAEALIKEEQKPSTGAQETYLAYLSGAMADGFLSSEEEVLLEKQRGILDISWDKHIEMLAKMGYSQNELKQNQQAKIFEDSGRFIESAAIYESLGNLDKAQMLRMKAKLLEGGAGGGQTTYNISDSVIPGRLDGNN